jgi:hypothetical protein
VGAAVTLSSSLAPSRVFDVAGGSAASGARIQLYASNATAAQRFRLEKAGGAGYYTIKNIKSDKVLGSAGGKAFNGAAVRQQAADGTAAQRFSINKIVAPLKAGTYTVASALAKSKVLDVAGGSVKDGANVQLYGANGTVAQSFRLSYDTATGYYTMANAKSGKVLEVEGAGVRSGTNVWVYRSNNTFAQRWAVVKGKVPGTYVLYSALSGLVLDVSGGSAANGANVQVYVANGTPAQAWVFKSG